MIRGNYFYQHCLQAALVSRNSDCSDFNQTHRWTSRQFTPVPVKRTNSGAATSAQARWDPPSSITVPPSYNRTKMREKGTEIKRTFVERQREPRVCDDMGVVVEHRRKITTRNENKISRGGRTPLSRVSPRKATERP